jgi:hypothetical protein
MGCSIWCECRWIGRSGLSFVARELAVRVGHFPGGNRTVRQLLFVRKKPASIPAGVSVRSTLSLCDLVSCVDNSDADVPMRYGFD